MGTLGVGVGSCLPPAFLPGFPGRLAPFRACSRRATVSEARVVSNTHAGRGGKGELLLYLRPANIRMFSFSVPDYTIFFFFIGMRSAPKDRDQTNSFILPLSPMKYNSKQWSNIRIHGLSSLSTLGLSVVQSVLDTKRNRVPVARNGIEAHGFAHSPQTSPGRVPRAIVSIQGWARGEVVLTAFTTFFKAKIISPQWHKLQFPWGIWVEFLPKLFIVTHIKKKNKKVGVLHKQVLSRVCADARCPPLEKMSNLHFCRKHRDLGNACLEKGGQFTNPFHCPWEGKVS